MEDEEIESRALSVEADDQAWFAKQITRDHKPDDPDEQARILSMNGRIESYKGRYGENVGPARVWLKHEQYPGLAMSRSIGDACAHSVGVSALPGKSSRISNRMADYILHDNVALFVQKLRSSRLTTTTSSSF